MLLRPRGDPVALLSSALLAGALGCVSPIATSFAVAVGLFALVRVGRRFLPIVCAALYLVGAWRAGRALSAQDHARDAALRAEHWPARIELRGRVVRSPILLGDGVRVDVEDDRYGRVTLTIPTEGAPSLARGDLVTCIGQLAPLDRFANEGVLDSRVAHARRGVVLSGGALSIDVVRSGRGPPAWIDRARAHVRARIVATFTPETNGMARALVLGEDDVGDDDRRAFRKSGLAHLLAVSGMHLVLVVASFVAAIRAVLVRISPVVARWDAWRIACAAGIPLVWLYADFAGGSGSAMRAAWMTSAALLARVLDRKPDAWRAAGLALAAIAITDPLAVFDLSFVLSALATAGLLAIAPPIAEEVTSRWPSRWPKVPEVGVRAIAATAAATIACTPVLACMAPDLPLGSLVANLVAVPLGEAAALPLCLAHALLAPLPSAEHGAAIAASGALALVRIIARVFARAVVPIPMPSAIHLTVIAAGAIATFAARRFTRARVAFVATLALVVVELVARFRGAPHGILRATFLDVAQGDAAFVDLPDGSAMLIDGGGIVGSPVDVGERVVRPFLRARRRSRIDVVVLSHPHPDHFLGLASALDDGAIEVGELWDTGQGESEGAGPVYDGFLARMRARGVKVLRPRDLCGTRMVGGAAVEVLAPCPDVVGDRGPNDNSFVLRIRYGARSFLFAGDAEHVEENDLVARGGIDADVLKVSHHGSRTSTTPAFLQAVHPSLAVISCGVRNRFGHPSAITLDTLESAGVPVLRTDRDGSIVVSTNGTTLKVEWGPR